MVRASVAMGRNGHISVATGGGKESHGMGYARQNTIGGGGLRDDLEAMVRASVANGRNGHISVATGGGKESHGMGYARQV
ncbi:hypothetical protein L2E82_08665 [Cichorium intybus]|uniref:Uncharacterized protein n=1 Tax=Cichorium intybus TaxID=13427 RepID=A0ACB9G7U1_CICIN|nr:hypothetical protein L2E82_08665 [Cichorium intybus]